MVSALQTSMRRTSQHKRRSTAVQSSVSCEVVSLQVVSCKVVARWPMDMLGYGIWCASTRQPLTSKTAKASCHLLGWAGRRDLRTRLELKITAALIIITSVPCRIAYHYQQANGRNWVCTTITAEQSTGWRKETTSSTSFTHNHDRGSAERQIGKEDSGEMQ